MGLCDIARALREEADHFDEKLGLHEGRFLRRYADRLERLAEPETEPEPERAEADSLSGGRPS